MELYANPHKPDHAKNNAAFLSILSEFPEIQIFQPSPQSAPWHWQAIVDGPSLQTLNFWPHRMQAQRGGMKAVQGRHEVINVITDAIIDAKVRSTSLIGGDE